MALKIQWTPEAEENFDEIVSYLEREFGDASDKKFIQRVNLVLEDISRHPDLFEQSQTGNSRKGFVSRQTSLYYRVNIDWVELLSFWNNRRHPDCLK